MTGNTKVQMKNRKLKKWITNLKTVLIYGTVGTIILAAFFYILIGAILQTSYRLSPVTQEEMEIIHE